MVSILSNVMQVFKVGLHFVHVSRSERYGLLGLVVGVEVVVIRLELVIVMSENSWRPRVGEIR